MNSTLEEKIKRKSELTHFLLFVIICITAYIRSDLEDLFVEEAFFEVKIVGEIYSEGYRSLTTAQVLRSEVEEIEGRRAFISFKGVWEFPTDYFRAFGKIKIKEGRIYLYPDRENITFFDGDNSIRKFLKENYIDRTDDQRVRAVGLSFLFGESRSKAPPEVQRSFLTTGLVHLLVISGLHIATIAGVFMAFLPRFTAMKVALVFIFLYTAFIVPHNPPVIRASIMVSLFLISSLAYQKTVRLSVLFFSGSVILLLFPHFVREYSFWMSMVATLYILLSLQGVEGKGRLLTSLLVSLSAFAGVSPLIATLSYISPMSVIFTPLISSIVFAYSFTGVLSLLSLMSFPPFIDLFNLIGSLFIKAVDILEKLSVILIPSISLTESVLLITSGAVGLYIVQGMNKILVPLLMSLYLLIRSF